MQFYRQCSLQKKLPDGATSNQVSWIPEQFAVLNKYLKLMENGIWDNGWQVISIGGRQSRQERVENNRMNNKHREGSDI